MPQTQADYRFRLEVLSPVAANSPFDSDTLWGRILCSLFMGGPDESELAERWLADLAECQASSRDDWTPPLVVSEGFQCDAEHEPWMAIPFCVSLRLQHKDAAHRKELKKVERAPASRFVEMCRGTLPEMEELVQLNERSPRVATLLQPHLSVDRLSGKSLAGQLYMTSLCAYFPPEIVFFLRIREADEAKWVEAALRRACEEGWGGSRSRGLGRLRFKSLEPWSPPPFPDPPNGFVSLSHFCPAAIDPTDGLWKLHVKHPVPAQFVNGTRVALGEESLWRVKSFLRLQAGSCFRLNKGDSIRPYYGRFLNALLDPAQDGDGQSLPTLFHYALAFPWPIRWPGTDKRNP